MDYEIRTYRVVWIFRMGWIGDAEGRTWAEKLYAEAEFPTEQQAQFHMENHPDCWFNHWVKEWRPKYDNGKVGIFREERLIESDYNELLEQRNQAQLLVAEANNSLYGSQAYFHSLIGGDFDMYHLARGIEKLKEETRKMRVAMTALVNSPKGVIPKEAEPYYMPRSGSF